MGNLNYNHGIVTVVDETTPGTAEVPDAGDGGIIVSNISYNPNPKPIDRDAIISSKGQIAALMSPAWEPTIEFDTELKGGGAAGSAPLVGEILKAANFSETVTPATSVVYELDGADDHKTLAWDIKDDDGVSNGLRFLVYGALCGISLSLGIERPGSLRVRTLGKYQAVSDVAPLTPTLELLKPPFFIGGTATFDATALNIREFSLDLNPELFLVPKLSDAQGWDMARIGKLKPTYTLVLELPKVATKDLFGKMRAADELALAISTPAVAGNTIAIAASKLQITNIVPSDDRGIVLATVTGPVNYGGTNHFKITMT